MKLPWSREESLGRLLRRSRAGDREAFRALYRELHPRVWGYLARRCDVRADAEDLTARTFEKFLAQLGKWDEGRGSPLAFALGIARNLLIDELRARRPGAGDSDLQLIDHATPHSLLEQARALRALRGALARRSPETRELLSLRFVEGLSHREIGELLQAGEDAVKQRFSRALRELRDDLQANDLREEVP
jgi:RNA polymerase sigma-70 factor (ECF subfamily)